MYSDFSLLFSLDLKREKTQISWISFEKRNNVLNL